MSTKRVPKAAKTTKKSKVTLKSLIARTEKIATEAATLLGELRSLNHGPGVTITLASGGTIKQSASPPEGP